MKGRGGIATLAAMMQVMALLGVFGPRARAEARRPEKSCLYCGRPHHHNNSFCSAEHCRLYRKGERMISR